MPRQTKKQSKKVKLDLSNQGYLYCCKSTYKGKIVYKIGKTINLKRRLEEFKTLIPDAEFVVTCPPCKNQAECYDFKKNYPRKMIIDHHLAERVIHILLKGYRIGSSECFSINHNIVRDRFKEIQRMSVDRLKNVINNKKTYEELSVAKRQLEEKSGMKFFEGTYDTTQDPIETEQEVHTDEDVDVDESEPETEAETEVELEEYPDSETDDEDEKFSNDTKKYISKIKESILRPLTWAKAGLYKDFCNFTVTEQKSILRYLEIKGLSKGDDEDRLKLLKDWYQDEKVLLVKCRFPFKYRLKSQVKSSKQDKVLDQLIETFDNKFHDELHDEKDPHYDDLYDNYLSDLAFSTDSTIEGYLSCKMEARWTNKNNKKVDESSIKQTVRKTVTKIKKIATYIISRTSDSGLFEAKFKCNTEKDPIIKYRLHGVDCFWMDH